MTEPASAPPEPAITLPVPPEGYSDPLSGRVDLSALRIRYERVTLDSFSFSELDDPKIRSFAGDSASVTF